MKRITILTAAMALASMTIYAADSGPKDAVTNAVKALQGKANYSWKTTTVVPESAQFKPGPSEGQTEKGGFTYIKMSFMDNTMETVVKGDKTAFKGQDGWQAAGDQGQGRFMRGAKAPAEQALDILAALQDLKKDGDVLSGDMTEAGAKNLMSFRRGGNGGEAPAITNPKGSAKFWIKDGVLSKFEFKVTGKMDFQGNPMDVDRDTTVEIKDVGTTKLTVPEEAKKLVQ